MEMLLHDPDPGVRVGAANTLAHAGVVRSNEEAALRGMLSDGSPILRHAAACGLAAAGATESLPELRAGLGAEDLTERCECVADARYLGPAAAPMADDLRRFLADPNEGTRAWAAVSLAFVGPSGAEERAALLTALEPVTPSSDPRLKAWALAARAKLGDQRAATDLAECAKDPSELLRAEATAALGRL
jgi:HEAT repeat protein